MQTQVKFHHQFHFTVTFKCLIQSSTMVSTFGVARNDFLRRYISQSYRSLGYDVNNLFVHLLLERHAKAPENADESERFWKL